MVPSLPIALIAFETRFWIIWVSLSLSVENITSLSRWVSIVILFNLALARKVLAIFSINSVILTLDLDNME